MSDSDNDSERDEWEQEQERIINDSEYQEGAQRIWNTAEGVLGKEQYDHFYYLFNDFMIDKMKMKRVFPANGGKASLKLTRRWQGELARHPPHASKRHLIELGSKSSSF